MPPLTIQNGDGGGSGGPVSAGGRRRQNQASAPPTTALPPNPKMEEFLKTWRQDALNKHQYDAAVFIGDKLLALTGEN